jgi:1-deoxyxylulose-5-phosphate synthase
VPELISEAAAIALVHAALAAGITTYDTAPAYGVAEERLGRALDGAGEVWTKLGHDRNWSGIDASLDRSCARLGRHRLDLMQVHNWSPTLDSDGVLDALARDPRIAAVGCSTYGVDDARSAVHDGRFAVVQVEWNLLNQEVIVAVGAEAQQRGVRLAVRSVLLQGVLTAKPLSPHRAGLTLPAYAIAAACGHPHIERVLIGLDSPAQLATALAGAAHAVEVDSALHVGGPLTDPRTWNAA